MAKINDACGEAHGPLQHPKEQDPLVVKRCGGDAGSSGVVSVHREAMWLVQHQAHGTSVALVRENKKKRAERARGMRELDILLQ